MMETLLKAQSIVYVDKCLYFYRETIPGSSSLVKDPSIIYNRWFDMDQILKKNLPVSPNILEGHYNRGCAYPEELNEHFSQKTKKSDRKILRAFVQNTIEHFLGLNLQIKCNTSEQWTSYGVR